MSYFSAAKFSIKMFTLTKNIGHSPECSVFRKDQTASKSRATLRAMPVFGGKKNEHCNEINAIKP